MFTNFITTTIVPDVWTAIAEFISVQDQSHLRLVNRDLSNQVLDLQKPDIFRNFTSRILYNGEQACKLTLLGDHILLTIFHSNVLLCLDNTGNECNRFTFATNPYETDAKGLTACVVLKNKIAVGNLDKKTHQFLKSSKEIESTPKCVHILNDEELIVSIEYPGPDHTKDTVIKRMDLVTGIFLSQGIKLGTDIIGHLQSDEDLLFYKFSTLNDASGIKAFNIFTEIFKEEYKRENWDPSLSGNGSGICCNCFQVKEGRVYAGASDGNVTVFEIATGAEMLTEQIFAAEERLWGQYGVCSILVDKSLVVVGSNKGEIAICDALTLKVMKRFKAHTQAICSIKMRDNYLYTSSHDTKVKLWDLSWQKRAIERKIDSSIPKQSEESEFGQGGS